jgi:quinol monooxygenase YgiN
MIIVHVYVHVKPDSIEAFTRATVANASASVREPGIVRFDVIQREDDPTRFVLMEAYRTVEAMGAHKDTAHYQAWRDAVAPMMAEPRTNARYSNVFPDETEW